MAYANLDKLNCPDEAKTVKKLIGKVTKKLLKDFNTGVKNAKKEASSLPAIGQ